MYKQNSHSRWIGSADYFKVCSPQKINNHNHSVSADLHLCGVCMLCFAVLIVIFSDSWLINCSMTSESKDSLPLTSYCLSDIVIYNNTQTSADITHRLFSTPCWFESVPWTDSPLLCLESILCLLPHIWEEKKKKAKRVSSPLFVVVEVVFILPLYFTPSQVFVLQLLCHGEGLPLSTAMLRSRLGLKKKVRSFEPPASWGKVNHIPPVFMFWC